NSLTLSPALSALLLKPRQKGRFEPLPWFAFIPIGAWLGHKAGVHWAGPLLQGLHLNVSPETFDSLRLWGPIVLGVLAGLAVAVVELVLGLTGFRPVNFLLGRAFRWVNRGFDAS